MFRCPARVRLGLGFTLAAALAIPQVIGAPLPKPGDRPGQYGVFLPEAVTDGSWDGTWFFNSVDSKIALWMRTKRSKTEIRLKYESGLAPVTFETDWNGNASYFAFEKPATFKCHITKSTPDRLEGTWFWDYQLKSLGRSERGKFTMFRAVDGRTAVIQFTEYELTETHDGKTGHSTSLPIWSFGKASKYQALWDELPF